jgi:GAF domain-containing protein
MPPGAPPRDPAPEPPPGARRAAVARAVRAGSGSQELQRLVRRAARRLQVPMAMVSLIAEDREVVAAAIGLPEPWASVGSVPLSHSLCAEVVHLDGAVVLFDARLDPGFRGHPAVVEMGAAAYAGYPLRHEGQTLGAFCVADVVRRQWSDRDLRLLEDLAGAAAEELTTRIGEQEREDGRSTDGGGRASAP